MSYRPEVIADSSGKWCPNQLRFATEQEAQWYCRDLAARWTAVRETRVRPSDDDVNVRVINYRLQHWPWEGRAA